MLKIELKKGFFMAQVAKLKSNGNVNHTVKGRNMYKFEIVVPFYGGLFSTLSTK